MQVAEVTEQQRQGVISSLEQGCSNHAASECADVQASSESEAPVGASGSVTAASAVTDMQPQEAAQEAAAADVEGMMQGTPASNAGKTYLLHT